LNMTNPESSISQRYAPDRDSSSPRVERDAQIDNTRITSVARLPSPTELKAALPVSDLAKDTIISGRRAVESVLDGKDSKLVVVLGPCSIHDVQAAMDYANRLYSLREQVKDVMHLVMRVYFEKPRTTLGWKGLVNDPRLDGSFNMGEGLHTARSLLIEIAELGLPTATEALDPIVPGYIGDLVTWTAIGARTTESQTHREMASGLSSPVGFKNGTSGDVNIAISAIKSAASPHSFLGPSPEGLAQINTKGNPYGHMVLRGGANGTNYDFNNIDNCAKAMQKAGLRANIMVDCSHENSKKIAAAQEAVFRVCIDNILDRDQRCIIGLMLESNIMHGSQKIPNDLSSGFQRSSLQYGVSITDECLGFEDTQRLLIEGAERLRSKNNKN
jgi:3-deoxy-7-phosphoheptulonate synthase